MNDIKEIKGYLKEKIRRTGSVVSFRFRLNEKVDFLPGQFMEVIFNKDDKNLRHWLSFSSSPARDYIEFTKRITDSSFSQKLKELKEGSEVTFRLPFGKCVLEDEHKKVAFISGGIGITPVISMLEHNVEFDSGRDFVLFYSNRTENEIAFKDNLDIWRNKSKNIKVIYSLTESSSDCKDFCTGRITADLIKEKLPDLKDRFFFVFGPPKMVEAMQTILSVLNIEDSRIKVESFIGY